MKDEIWFHSLPLLSFPRGEGVAGGKGPQRWERKTRGVFRAGRDFFSKEWRDTVNR